MQDQLPALVILTPFFGAMLVSLLGLWRPATCFYLTVVSLGLGLAASIAVAVNVLSSSPIIYKFAGWSPPMGIVLYIDALNAFVAVTIMVVAFLAAIASKDEIEKGMPHKRFGYYTLFLLFVTGVLGITLTGDAFNLYVLIEVCSLTSYALIAQKNKRAMHASFNYLIIGMVGACFYLLGVGYLLIKTGTLNMLDINTQISALGLEDSPSIQVAFCLIMVGLFVKMAQFPMHGWLPNAYTHCPQSSANLMAPLMTKVMVYVMARMMIDVFGLDYIAALPWKEFIIVLASIGIVAGSFMALAQKNLRRALTYIIVAEVGYMVGGLWIMNDLSMSGALYHIVADAAMTACLFITLGLIINKTGKDDRSAFDGLFAKMPLTMGIFIVGAFSMIGIPPLAGFFSKWYLIGGGIDGGYYYYVVALLLSSLCNAVIFFRLIENAFFGSKPTEGHATHDSHEHEPSILPEAPTHQIVPALTLAVILVVLGLMNHKLILIFSQTLFASTP